MSISSATSWVDGDPLTPTTLNAKLNPLVDAINAITDSPSVTGSGTSGYVPRWASISTFVSNTTLVNGTIRDYGANGVAVGGEPESAQSFLVYGPSKVSGALTVTTTATVPMLTISGSTTSINGVQYTWPSTQGAQDQALVNNGSGGLTWETVGGFTDSTITSDTISAYSVVASDVNRRLIVSRGTLTNDAAVVLTNSALSSVATGAKFQIAAFGARTYVNSILSSRASNDTTLVVGPPNARLYRVVRDANNKVLIGGDFTLYSGSSVTYLARLNEDGSRDSAFLPSGLSAGGGVRRIVIDSAGSYLVGINAGSGITRINQDGAIVGNVPTLNGSALQISELTTGKLLIAGAFSTVNGSSLTNLTRVNASGSTDTTFTHSRFSTVGGSSSVNDFKVRSDGKIVIGGSFSGIDGQYYANVARLNVNGSVDTSFVSSIVTGGAVSALALQADGKILIVGSFRTIDTTARNRIARLNEDGSLDTTYDPSANNGINDIVIEPDSGKAVVGGTFTTIVSTARNRIARLNTDGTLDTTFNPNASGGLAVYGLGYDNDGSLLVAGDFTQIGASAVSYGAKLGRMRPIGSTDTISAPGLSYGGSVTSIPQYGVATLEKRGDGQWVVTGTNY